MRSSSGKWFVLGFFSVLFAVVYFFLDVSCSGWNVINPFCQLGNITVAIIRVVALFIITTIMIVLSVHYFVKNKTIKNLLLLAIFIVLAAISWSIPFDPIPFIDEVVTAALVIMQVVKVIKQ